MNTKNESKHAVEQPKVWFSKLIAKSTAASLGLALVVVGLFLPVPIAQAQTKLSTADTDFILAAAQGGMTEVKLGELAAQKGTRDDVKGFGQMMVKDHTSINSDLKALATQKSVTLPDSLDAKHQGMVDKMAALTLIMTQVNCRSCRCAKPTASGCGWRSRCPVIRSGCEPGRSRWAE